MTVEYFAETQLESGFTVNFVIDQDRGGSFKIEWDELNSVDPDNYKSYIEQRILEQIPSILSFTPTTVSGTFTVNG